MSGGIGNRQTDAEIRPLPCNHNAKECPIGKQAIEPLHQGAAHIVIKGIAGVASHHQMAHAPVTHDPDRTSHHLGPRLATTTRLFGR